MKSKISCCNAGLLRRSVLRGAPLWGLWLLGGLIVLPFHLLSMETLADFEGAAWILTTNQWVSSLLVFGYGLLVAWYQFAWLYRTRSAYHYGSLPLRRETQFLTRYLSGLLFHVAPAAVVSLLALLVAALRGANCAAAVGALFSSTTLAYLFYYSLAVLLAQMVGHTAALPVLYVVLNFTSVVVETILSEVIRTFPFGMASGQNLWPNWLSPVFYTLEKDLFGFEWITEALPQTTVVQGIYFTGWVPALVFGAVGLGLAALAFLLFRRRNLESAGDVIAFSFLKPVFLYGLSLGCSVVLGWLLSDILFRDGSSQFLPMVLCMLLGAALGFWAGEMLLQKSLRVLRRRNLLRCGITWAVIIAAMCCCRYDVTGFSHYVPDPADVQSVMLGYGDAMIEDREIIQRATQLHQEIVDRRFEIEAQVEREGYHTSYRVTYQMNDGSVVSRQFSLPVDSYGDYDRSSLGWAVEELENTPAVLLAQYFPDHTGLALDRWTVEYLDTDWVYQQMELTYDQAEALAEAIRADIEAGTLGGDGISWPYERNDYDLQVRMAYYVSGQRLSYDSISVTAAAERTCAVLRELGVPEAVIAGEAAD